MGAIMPAVLPLTGTPLSGTAPSRRTGSRLLHVPRCALPLAGATVVVVLAVHLLADLIGRADPADPVGLLSVAMGMLAVSVVLVPFAVMFVARTCAAWSGAAEPRSGERPARARAI